MRLDQFSNIDFDRGASFTKELLWYLADSLLVGSWLPGSSWRKLILRAFGAKIGIGVVLKARINIKFPWRLVLGDHCWIGERVWLDNLAIIEIGEHSCVSQGAYLCTGNHDWTRETFDLRTAPIKVGQRAWIGAMVRLSPGTIVQDGTIVTLGSIANGTLNANKIYSGVPAVLVGDRRVEG